MDETLAEETIIGDRFRIDGVLGSGAFGVTYAGVELATDRPVAVKRLDLRGLRDWKGLQLFEREALVLRRLSHPQIPAPASPGTRAPTAGNPPPAARDVT